jgi:heme exporter protein B
VTDRLDSHGAGFVRHTLAILRKDLLAEWHTKERLSTMVFFVLLSLLVFNFSFELGGYALAEIGPGILWSAFVFASLFGLHRSFASEQENHCLEALLLSPASREAVYLGKMLGNLLFLLLVELLSLPFFALFFNLSLGPYLPGLLAVFVLGSAALAAVGTLFAAMCSNLRLRELLLPLLLLPMAMPALICCVESTAAVLARSQPDRLYPYLRMLAVYTAVFTGLSALLFAHVVEE